MRQLLEICIGFFYSEHCQRVESSRLAVIRSSYGQNMVKSLTSVEFDNWWIGLVLNEVRTASILTNSLCHFTSFVFSNLLQSDSQNLLGVSVRLTEASRCVGGSLHTRTPYLLGYWSAKHETKLWPWRYQRWVGLNPAEIFIH